MLCQHCRTHPANRPRGLCWRCYFTPSVRVQYPAREGYSFVSGDFCGTPPLPSAPTTALPGTAAKTRVLIERATSKQALWHPLDAQPVDTALPGADVSLPAFLATHA